MRVFCIVNANLYLNGTDHGQTDRIISGKIRAERNVKTNEATELCLCLCLWPGCSGFPGCKNIEQQAALQSVPRRRPNIRWWYKSVGPLVFNELF